VTREYSGNPPGRIRQRPGEFYTIPKPSPPQTHWKWHARFPETAQLVGGWFSQDIVDEFPDHDAASQKPHLRPTRSDA